MEKLRMTSPDLTAANIDKIAELFPNVLTETVEIVDGEQVVERAIDFDLLRQELSNHIVDGPQERYQLDWPGKRAAAFAANAPIAKTLRPVREESVDFDTTKNLFIEGDNLEVLKLIQESYLAAVDFIYIDPPYNTGNDRFIYPDNFVTNNREWLVRSRQSSPEGVSLVTNTESNGRFHADWLTMMYPRLKLAKSLLKDTGIICISIGDDELAQLRLVCDELFGRANCLAIVTVEMSTTQGMKVRAAQNGAIVKNSEFILVYARSSAHVNVDKTPLYDSVAGWPGNFGTWLHEDLSFEPLADVLNRQDSLVSEAREKLDQNKVRLSDLSTLYQVSTIFRDFVHSNLERIAASDKGSWPDGKPEPMWEDGQAFEYEQNSKRFAVMKSSKGTIRQFLRLSDNFRISDDYEHSFGRTVIRGDLWKKFYSDMAHVSLEGGVKFENGKKPVRLIENLLKWANNSPNSLVMDFFAGSGSTGDAIFRMNASDGGSRRFILVQLDEDMNPASDSGKAGMLSVAKLARNRLKNASSNYTGESTSGDFGFRSLRVDASNMLDVLKAPDETGQEILASLEASVRPGRGGEDLLFQVLLDWGLELSLSISRELVEGHEVLVVDDGALIACFDEDVDLALVRTVAKREPLRAVFRDSAFPSDAVRINTEQIFRELSPSTDVKTI